MFTGQGGNNLFGNNNAGQQGGLFGARPAQPNQPAAAPGLAPAPLFGGAAAPQLNPNPLQGNQQNLVNPAPLNNLQPQANANQANNAGQVQLGQLVNQPLGQGLNLQGGLQGGLNQQNQQQQQQQQLNQQKPPQQFIEKCRSLTNKRLDDILKSAEIKDQIDKNQETLKQIEKVALYSADYINKFAVNANQQAFPKPPQPIDRKTISEQDLASYTGKTLSGYKKYSDKLNSVNKNQDETIKNLTSLKRMLKEKIQGNTQSLEEESVGSTIEQLQRDVDKVNKGIEDVVRQQNRLLSQMQDDGDHWEHSYKSLYGCLMQLNDDINETENMITVLENLPKMKTK